MKVGFIGLGSMGGDQARCLAETSVELTVFDVAPAAVAAFEGKAALAKSMAETGRDADVVCICVRDDAQVNDCADALLPVMPAGSVLLIHSTVKPATVKAIAEKAAARGISVLDAPVTRTEMGASGPFVFTMTGGDEAVHQRVKPVLDAFSTNTLHVGPLGSGMALKISNNMVTWGQILLGLEAFRLAESAGVPTECLQTVMLRNGGLTPPMRSFIENRAKCVDPDFRAFMASQAGIGEKDVSLAEALGKETGAPTPMANYTRTLVREAVTNMGK